MKNLYIIIPAFNESAILKNNAQTILKSAQFSTVNPILFLIDDGSTDNTAAVFEELKHLYPHNIKTLRFLRNFGKEAAIFAGLQAAFEDSKMAAAVVMDADLQHPPALLAPMFQAWEKGAKLVEAKKNKRGDESWLYKKSAQLFYKLFGALSGGVDFEGQTDFKWLDREIVAHYLNFSEKRKFFRGMIAWLGVPSVQIPFDVPERKNGKSRWRITALLRYALENLQSFSNAPLQIVSACGVLSFFISFIFGSIALFQKINGQAVEGFTTLIILLSFFTAIIMLALGVVGFYLSAIYNELKQRPIYLLQSPENKK